MDKKIVLTYDVDGNNYSSAGEASGNVKRKLKQLGVNPETVRRAVIAMYEGEINMVIHADGGTTYVEISAEKIYIELKDNGPGISDVGMAMREGYSTASEEARNLGFGAGMGLPNIKKYADEFEIETEVGKGTTLKITVYC